MNITPHNITRLNSNEVFVFGSNLAGRHGRGAAKTALDKFGAVYGKGIGLFGQSYGIPTVNETVRRTLTITEIKPFVDDFMKFVEDNPSLHFLITEIGCGLAGHNVNDMALLFKDLYEKRDVLKNYSLPQRFVDVLDKNTNGFSKEGLVSRDYIGGDVV